MNVIRCNFWAILKKNSSYVSGLRVCIFVALCVRISVAGANKVEGTMNWCLGTYEILASTHDIAKGEKGNFETTILILHNFFVFYYG